MRQLAVLILLSFMLSACAQGAAPAVNPAAPAQPTELPSQSPVPVASPSPAETINPLVIDTLDARPTRTPSVTASPASSRTPTLNPTFALAPKLSFSIDCNEQSRSYSPDLEWVAIVCLMDGGYAVTKVYSLDGQHNWNVWPSQQEISSRPVKYTYLKPFHWIVTGGYLYLVGYTCCQDVKAKWYSGYSLERLDLVTGKLDTIIDGLPGVNAFHFGFSAGEGFLMIFDMTYDYRLRFISLVNGTVQIIFLPQSARFVGNEVWAPFGTEMALEGCVSSDVFKVTCDTYSIYLVDFNRRNADILVRDTSTLPQVNNARKPVEISKIEWEDGYNLRVYDAASDQSWEVSAVVVWPTPTESIWQPTVVTPTP